ncbi:MAG TPA: acyl-CoA dehydrogenase family protein [Trebonia sp.]
MSEQSVTDFRKRARAWLEEHAPRRGDESGEPGRAGIPAQRAFQARLYDAGFAGLTWPRDPVLNAAQADVLLVPAADGGRTALFEVAAPAPGTRITPLPSLDHSRCVARVELAAVPGRRLDGDAGAALGFAADLANLAVAAEQLGGLAACLAMTAGYAKIRLAFGRPIGSFQGVKHRLADLRTSWELAHAALRDAARAADQRPADFPRAASVARIAVSARYVDAALATVQLHGGIGFTWEHDAHLYHKNAVSQHALFGGSREQLDRLAAQLASDPG